jgi:hypothetical protein
MYDQSVSVGIEHGFCSGPHRSIDPSHGMECVLIPDHSSVEGGKSASEKSIQESIDSCCSVDRRPVSQSISRMCMSVSLSGFFFRSFCLASKD